jgi:hypothetical protein
MKKLLTIFLTVFMVALSTVSFAQNLKKLDEKNGFRDAVLGSDTTSFNDLVVVEKEGNSVYYKRTGENLTVGDFTLDAVTYGFYKGKLSTIIISTKGYTNSRGLLQIFNTQYGRGYQSNRYIEKYSWSGKNVIMSYNENSATNDANIFMWSKQLSDQEALDKKNAASKAAGDI